MNSRSRRSSIGPITESVDRCRVGLTLVESLVGLVLVLLVLGFVHHTTELSGETQRRLGRLGQAMDARTLQDRLDRDLRTAVEIETPAIFGADSLLVFRTNRHQRLIYEKRESGKGPEGVARYSIVRLQSQPDGELQEDVLASDLLDVVFHRPGRDVAGYYVLFAATEKERRESRSKHLVLRSSVSLTNHLY